METLKCAKHQFHNFTEHQGWLLLFDKINEDGSEVGYLLQNGETLLAIFDNIGEFKEMNDITNTNISVDVESIHPSEEEE